MRSTHKYGGRARQAWLIELSLFIMKQCAHYFSSFYLRILRSNGSTDISSHPLGIPFFLHEGVYDC